ncbi:MAG: hypothetical protein M3345_03285 [Actinomycetota bacterium]|nr:hypothetical protein [Actinomycetota bacterium]
MHERRNVRVVPFALAAAFSAIVCLAVVRIPDIFLGQIERSRPFTDAQAGWAFRLIALAALAQVLYGGFVVLRPETVARARTEHLKTKLMTRSRILTSVTRTAAGMMLLTLVYGLAALYVTAQRGGFWLFPAIEIAQGAWYYRQVGEIGRWLGFQPEVEVVEPREGAWNREPPDYCPPIARGLKSAPAGEAVPVPPPAQ